MLLRLVIINMFIRYYNMDNYYEILDISEKATIDEVKQAYNNHINRFNNLPFLTDKMKEEIKKYKKALYVLSDYHRRKLYDNKKNLNKSDKFDPRNFHFRKPEYIDDGKINDRLFGNTFK